MKRNNLLRNKFFWLQFVLAFVLLIIIVLISNKVLKKYTNHNEEFLMPDLVEMQYDSLMMDSAQINFHPIIIDSIYVLGCKPNVILRQNPLAGSKIKPGRKVYLVVSSSSPGKVVMPDLRDVSIRQASNVLEAMGLKLGFIHYQPTFDRNAVQAQLFHETNIAPGTMIERGSIIDLIVGAGFDNFNTEIPFLFGSSLNTCRRLLLSTSLNIGKEIFINVENYSDAVAFKCVPEWIPDSVVEIGTPIDVYYISKNNINVDSLKFVMLFSPEHREAASDLYMENYLDINFNNIDFEFINVEGEHPNVGKLLYHEDMERDTCDFNDK